MENASKALLIAGGILLALLTTSLLILVYNNMQSMQNAQAQKLETEQRIAFNKEYEAYNKSLLYGTDVITVVNKAINNNKKMELMNKDERFYINIKLLTNGTFKSEVYKEERGELAENGKTSKRTKLTDPDISSLTSAGNILDGIHIVTENIPGSNTSGIVTTNLGMWKKDGSIEMDKGVLAFFTQSATDTIKEDGYTNYYVYSALTVFKKTIFTCKSIEYSDETGRVKEITFVQCKEP